MSLLKIFSRRWILTTLLAAAGVLVLARLGIWQLDRLAERKVFNARVLAAVNLPALDLNHASLPIEWNDLEYARADARGVYDFDHQVGLRNQTYQGQLGAALLTPLHISGTDQTILVNRGWISAADFEAGKQAGRWPQYDQPGEVLVQGVLRLAQEKADFGLISDPTPAPGGRLTAWNLANLPLIAAQTPYEILPVYLQQTPDGAGAIVNTTDQPASPIGPGLDAVSGAQPAQGSSGQPAPIQLVMDLSEGPHFGYALQWFTFAALLLAGYPFFVLREEAGRSTGSQS